MIECFKVYLLHFDLHLNFQLPQGNVGTCLRCGEKYYVSIVGNFIIFFSSEKNFENRLTFA